MARAEVTATIRTEVVACSAWSDVEVVVVVVVVVVTVVDVVVGAVIVVLVCSSP